LFQIHLISFKNARASISVSYAPLAYYADRLCECGRAYLHDDFLGAAVLMEQLDLDAKKESKEETRCEARMKRWPRPTTNEGKKKCVKSEVETLQEMLDHTTILDELKVDVMVAAMKECI
jgi:eukaryotic translation initiation factor 2C